MTDEKLVRDKMSSLVRLLYEEAREKGYIEITEDILDLEIKCLEIELRDVIYKH